MTDGKAISADHAAVASEQPLASRAGSDVLQKGGNAFDAAVATAYALAVVFQPAGGLGGDFFGMCYEAETGKVHCLNGSGWSPSGLKPGVAKSFPESKPPQFGPHSVVVPGFVAGISEMHRRLGESEFEKLLELPGAYASQGFPAGATLCRDVAKSFPQLSPEARAVFAPGGKPPILGDLIRQESLARVISDIATSGPEAFYSGRPAEKIAGALSSEGAMFAAEDFADYKAEWVPPLTFDYRGATVYEVPPNSMGATSLLILKLLSGEGMGSYGPQSAKRVEATIRAALPAYARRDSMLGDPRFMGFDFDSFMEPPDPREIPRNRIRSADTTAFSIVDSRGNMVSAVLSLFDRFGSRIFVAECGILMNNRASGFSSSGPNSAGPRKRPLHTLSSLILESDGSPYLAIGTSGGDYRPLLHAQFVTNSVDYRLTPEQNVNLPRFVWTGGSRVLVEGGYEIPAARDYEYQTIPFPGKTGVCQAVGLAGKQIMAACDIRGDGFPEGF